jgi:hypothetical protein
MFELSFFGLELASGDLLAVTAVVLDLDDLAEEGNNFVFESELEFVRDSNGKS